MKTTKTVNSRRFAASSNHRRRGFTLIELLIGLAIIIGITGFLGVPLYQKAQQQNQIAGASRAIASAKSALQLYTQIPDWNGLVPITEGTGIPLTGTLGGTASVIQDAITLQTALLTARTLEAPIASPLGASTPPSGATTTPVQFAMATQTFFTSADAAPTQSYATTSRLECRLSVANTTAPSAAAGANFRLDGTNGLPANTRVVYWVFPNVSASLAYEFAKTMYKGTVAAQGSAQDLGPIVYPAADANGNTTVYAYVNAY